MLMHTSGNRRDVWGGCWYKGCRRRVRSCRGGGTSVQVGAELPTATVSRSASNTAESEDGDLDWEISPTHSHSAAYQINGHFKWRGGATRRRIFHSRNEFPAVSEKSGCPPPPTKRTRHDTQSRLQVRVLSHVSETRKNVLVSFLSYLNLKQFDKTYFLRK